MIRNSLLVLAGGGLGSLLRYLMAIWFPIPLPYSTLAVNTVSSFILGCVTGYLMLYSGKPLFSFTDNTWYILIGVGFCGGLSTFSSFTLDNYKAIVSGAGWIPVLLNITVNVILSFVALVAGVRLAKFF